MHANGTPVRHERLLDRRVLQQVLARRLEPPPCPVLPPDAELGRWRNVDLLHDYMETPASVHARSRVVLAGVLLVLLAALVGAAFVTVLILRWLVGLL